MARATVTVSADGARQLRGLARRLRRADLQRHVRDELADAGRPVVSQLRAAVTAVDVQSTSGGTTKTTGLRRRVAAATDMSTVRAGIVFRTHARRVDPRYPQLVSYLNAEPRVWPHPVFATGERSGWEWTVQSGEPWFFVTVRRNRPQFRRAVRRAVRKTNETIAG